MNTINTEKYSEKLRSKAIKIEEKKILITNYKGSLQEKDLTEPSNCNGYGRIRHFKFHTDINWPTNPLPIVPAKKYLKLTETKILRAQVFQNSVCNWRCWYCFVDFKLLNGDQRYSTFLHCDELLDYYLQEQNQALLIDLSGGQPDLTPEWIPWMMEALIDKNLQNKVFLWSDDNLSNDYFWRYLTKRQIELIQSYKMYARVCCFKGIDELSFELNTRADKKLFWNQFKLFKRLSELEIDLYAYVTLTAPINTDFKNVIPRFFDYLQEISHKLPLKTVPLKIFEFTPSAIRKNDLYQDLLEGQMMAINYWEEELKKRFTEEELIVPISEINLT